MTNGNAEGGLGLRALQLANQSDPVCRRAYREKLKREERKYLNAAHHQIFGEAQDSELGESIRAYTHEREIYERREAATETDEAVERPPEEVQRDGEEQDSDKYMW
ncbi:unnamed protein product [Dibothriocephalus latus]|uniref:Uncharacterized protein n=1 Tax=Dibothriocephalus latus TaxID=60516 RepID=A0A3P7P486_DIBLA|nr:unnamed protein product [Dibothriocephalus latus]